MAASSNTPRGEAPGRVVQAGTALGALSLGLVCIACMYHGVRAVTAQVSYFKAKFGADRDDLQRISERCETAGRLYPYNYYFAAWAGEKAYYRWEADAGEGDLLVTARRWCDTGLQFNGYLSSLRLLKTRLLRTESVEQATEYWREYVDWNFWNPYNHSVLAELYATGGKWGSAMQELRWVKGSPYYEHARQTVNELWREQMKPPE